ncbi:bifunctional DNA-formamidopyrimidine glycosylase/DNA-(apurinic or apyrimidinic site) lyase [Leucobacter sp. W1478]|uniref:bifunctional DNA-formamidopyrimidine glycosylase/DNA-(apurinic or apyrimidinic site) lyase n=1 Tax=Leucobacter sp. W1478 TaxID=3439065 RepID=UPI003F35504E
MPELPEVEVVRAGLAPAITGARVVAVEVVDPRALKRHLPLGGVDAAGVGRHGVSLDAESGALRAADFERRLTGAVLGAPARRGKFLWVPLGGTGEALLAHLGMSGQLLLRAHEAPDDRFVRIHLWISHPTHGELRLDFADQRLFGSLAIDSLVPTPDGKPGGTGTDLAAIPGQALHIARDPLDPAFDDAAFVQGLRARRSAVKVALLDQTLVSGIGNIYADEALWRARLHPETPASLLSVRKARELLGRIREVFAQALAEGGTSFDAQYVNVNGQAGYFAHSLNAYGRTGVPCPRCDTPIRKITLAGRSSHFCPRCQRKR